METENKIPYTEAAERLFFALLRAGLHPDRPVPASDAAGAAECPESVWREVYRISADQGVLGFVRDGMLHFRNSGVLPEGAGPSRQLNMQWSLNVERIETLYGKQRRAIARLAAFYRSHGIRMMLIKGYGVSLFYPHPEHRPCGDIDIWLYGAQLQADEAMEREWGIRIDTETHHHTKFTVDGILVENHYDFLNVHAHPSNRRIERELQRYAGEEGRTVEIEGVPVLLPSANFNALFLLRHAACHFAAEDIGMRHVADWARFIETQYDGIDWPALFRTAREMNMHRFLNSLCALSVDCLGMDAAIIPAFDRDPELERRIKNDILSPEFSEKLPHKGLLRILSFKFRRWWANRWKHRIVYREGLLRTFFVQFRSHLMKPQSFRH